jgi:hypothetical protein
VVGISLNNIPCVDPKEIRDYCVEKGLPTSWYGKPNKYVCPLGAEPGYGHLLFEEQDYKILTATTSAYTLRMQSQNGSVKFPGILLAGFPRNLTPGKRNPILMVEITDTRSNALKATNTRYSWRDSPSATTVVNEMTWAEVAEDLWNKNQFTQAFPGLPDGVRGGDLTIEQFDAHGFKVITALEDLLQGLGCAMNYDPGLDSYSIVYMAGDTETIQAFATKYRDGLIYEDIPYNSNPYFNYPDNIRVLFPVWSEESGADPRMVYAKDIALDLSGISGGSQGGTLILQDKQPLRVDSSGTLLNQTEIDDRANAVALIFQDRMSQTTCKWPISRAYRGFITGTVFDLAAWMDIGEGPMTAFLRQGIAGTGELYDTDSLPTEGLIESDHNPTMLYENGVAKRAMGLQPSQSRAKQNEGWWEDTTRDVIRLVGSGLGPYMMRTQSLRYGEYAQVSTGGRNDLRGRLYRPWVDAADNSSGNISAADRTRFCWVSGAEEISDGIKFYPALLMIQDSAYENVWSIEKVVYLSGANNETLIYGLKYMSHKADQGVTFTGAAGTLDAYHTFCCDGTPSVPPRFVSGCVSGGCYFPSTLYLELTPKPAPSLLPGSPTSSEGSCSGYSASTITIPMVLQASPTESAPIKSNTLNWMCDTGISDPTYIDILWQSDPTVLPDGQTVTMSFARPVGTCGFLLGSDRQGFLGTSMYCATYQSGYSPTSSVSDPTFLYSTCPTTYIGQAYSVYEVIIGGGSGTPNRCQFLTRVRL